MRSLLLAVVGGFLAVTFLSVIPSKAQAQPWPRRIVVVPATTTYYGALPPAPVVADAPGALVLSPRVVIVPRVRRVVIVRPRPRIIVPAVPVVRVVGY